MLKKWRNIKKRNTKHVQNTLKHYKKNVINIHCLSNFAIVFGLYVFPLIGLAYNLYA